MIFECQNKVLNDLPKIAHCGSHGLVLVGLSGCGKQYVAKQYAKLLGVSDFNTVQPTMNEIRAMVEDALTTEVDTVYCVKDMDTGVLSTFYPLLKLIEDCPSNINVVITCSNINHIPDTIISRCSVLTLPNPTNNDLASYGASKNNDLYKTLGSSSIWKCVKSFTDVDELFSLNSDQIKYFDTLIAEFNKPKVGVSNLAWKLQHFEDKSATPITLVIRYIMHINPTNVNIRVYLRCLDDLYFNRLSANAVLTKLVFDLKYLG